jgi:hypothetical protein
LQKRKKENNILFNNINNNYKLAPLNTKNNFTGKIKYLPADSKEWRNKVYFFNSNVLKNLPIYDKDIVKIIKGYFNLYLKNTVVIKKYLSRKLVRLSLNKIYVSRPEIKHTNSKTVLTLYIYNREGISLLKNLDKFKKSFLLKVYLFFFKSKNLSSNINSRIYKYLLYKELAIIRKHKLKLNYNKYKFEDIFLYKLGELIGKFYNRKVEFNIINLQSIVLNADIFTEFLKYKLKRNVNVTRMMNYILAKINLSKINSIPEKGRLIKSIDFNILENRYKNFNLNNVINNMSNLDNIIKILNDNIIYNEEYFSYSKNMLLNSVKNFLKQYLLFNSIKYKNIRGIRLEVKGRLTRRYRADRSIFRTRWKGGLKNIDSSFKGVSAVNFRGNTNSNIEYSLNTAKRRIGSFAVKGWISGK